MKCIINAHSDDMEYFFENENCGEGRKNVGNGRLRIDKVGFYVKKCKKLGFIVAWFIKYIYLCSAFGKYSPLVISKAIFFGV